MSHLLQQWYENGLMSRIYALVCSAAALLILATFLDGAGTRPSDVVAYLVRWSELPLPPSVLTAITGLPVWAEERREVLLTLTLAVAVLAALWSASHVHVGGRAPDVVRGPSTFWLSLLVAMEADPKQSIVLFLSAAAAAGVIVTALDLAHLSRGSSDRVLAWRLLGTYAKLGFGVVFAVVLLLPSTLLHAIGGAAPRRRLKAQDARDPAQAQPELLRPEPILPAEGRIYSRPVDFPPWPPDDRAGGRQRRPTGSGSTAEPVGPTIPAEARRHPRKTDLPPPDANWTPPYDIYRPRKGPSAK